MTNLTLTNIIYTKKSNVLHLEKSIKVNIFRPLNLSLTCKEWSNIAKDPYTKTEWLIYQFGNDESFDEGGEIMEIEKSFVPFPLRPRSSRTKLVELWREIGYEEI
ncbi:3433_t:CDS:1, partial [Funneliformis caledonium]